MKNVRIRKGYYTYRKQVDGVRREIRLCPVTDGEQTMRRILADINRPNKAKDLCAEYLTSPYFKKLRPATQRSYRIAFNRLEQDGITKTRYDELSRRDVASYLHRMLVAGHGTGANRYVAALSAAYNYAIRAGYIDDNPCHGVRRNCERPRNRLVTPAELTAAVDRAHEDFARLLQAAAMTGLRLKDLRNLRKTNLTAEGIAIEESKRGRMVLITWSDQLAALVGEAVRASGNEYVFVRGDGQKWSQDAVSARMRALRVDWRFHDLRAFNASYYQGDRGLLPTYKRYQEIQPLDLTLKSGARVGSGPVDNVLELVGRIGIEPITNGLRVQQVKGDKVLANQFLALPLVNSGGAKQGDNDGLPATLDGTVRGTGYRH